MNKLRPKILLLSAYDAASHKQWRVTLRESLPEFKWTELTLPARYFAWRTRGSSLTLAFEYSEILKQSFDLIVTTSMLDLASLRGFVPHLAQIPTVVYFHENQFVYPIDSEQPNIINAQLTSIYSALCADKILFNSQYNLESFFRGANDLLKKMPDGVASDVLVGAKRVASVIPVPIDAINELDRLLLDKTTPDDFMTDKSQCRNGNHQEIVSLVWNHRWEYDKQPDIFFNAVRKLIKDDFLIKVHVLGQSFRHQPKCFKVAEGEFQSIIGMWGYQPRNNYLKCLSQSDIVVSTAAHDFQGLSLLEAIALGCRPVAPNRVVYPDYLDKTYLYPLASEPEEEVHNLYLHLRKLLTDKANGESFEHTNVSQYSLETLIPQYKKLFNSLIELG